MASNPKSVDRIPPWSEENEKGVIGCCLQAPVECITQCQERLKSADVFYDFRHREIYETMVAMMDLKIPVDIISLQQWLKDSEVLEKVGGIAYLNELIDCVPSAANLDYYLKVVEEKHIARSIIRVCTEVIQSAFDSGKSCEDLLDELERKVLSVRPQQASKTPSIKELVSSALEKIEQLIANKDSITGIPTGLIDLDVHTDGLHMGEMTVIAAFPGCGKSALASGIAIHNALRKVPVGVFTLEMSPVSLAMRGIASESHVNLYDIRRGFVPQAGYDRMFSVASKISGTPIEIENANGMTISQLVAAARRMHQRSEIKLLVVDYIQLLSCPGCDTREQEISRISKGIKSIAMELGIPVLALSQLNDDGKLRESRAIGQDADNIWKLEPQGDKESLSQPTRLLIEKCRDGETGFIDLTFLKCFTRFESKSKVDDSDIPAER